jgi:hypothetical protein
MANQGFYYDLNEFQTTRTPGRWWPKAIAILALCGGIYGAAIGSAISTTAGAAEVIGIVAILMAMLCGVPGARFGFFLGILNRVRFGRLFLGMFAAMGGAIIGGFLGLMTVIPLGAILGAVAGWFFTQAILRGFFKRLFGGFVGLVLGACIGATVLAIQRDHAFVGIAWGLGIGGIGGPLPLLLFAKMMDALPPKRYTESKIIDVKVTDVPHDEN